MLEEMKEIIAEQLNCDEDMITEETSFKDDLGADSLDLFELVMALEEEYGLEIPAEELKGYDIVVLFTPTGVQALKQNCPDYPSEGRAIACFGAATKKAIEELGWEAAIAAPTPECTSITTALDKYLKAHK